MSTKGNDFVEYCICVYAVLFLLMGGSRTVLFSQLFYHGPGLNQALSIPNRVPLTIYQKAFKLHFLLPSEAMGSQ